MTAPRNVRLSEGLMDALVAAAGARGVRIDWGEPDDEGFYSPAIYALNAAELLAEPPSWDGIDRRVKDDPHLPQWEDRRR